MAEISYYWDGTVTGDATSAPYTAALYTTNWKNLFTRADDEGVISGYLNQLVVSGISGGVIVDTGVALVEGYFYENDAQVTVSIPTPTTDPRIDRIVIRKDPILQTARITRIAGTENPAPTAPAITQTVGGIFDIPLAQVLITIAGAITVTDERDYPWTPLIPTGIGITEIETIEGNGSSSNIDFQDIPQIYKHLRTIGSIRGSLSTAFADVFLNGDTTTANYKKQFYNTDPTPAVDAFALSFPMRLTGRLPPMVANEPSGNVIDFPYYISSFYKTYIAKDCVTNSGATQYNLQSAGTLWENTNAIERITLQLTSGVFETGTRVTLYGLS